MSYKTQNRKCAASGNESDSPDYAYQQIMRSAAKSMAHDRELMQLLPDSFTMQTAHDALGYVRAENTRTAIALLECAGFVEIARIKVPAERGSCGNRGSGILWRKTDHGKEFERES